MRLSRLALLIPAAYQILAIAAGVHQLWSRKRDERSNRENANPFQPGVSVLKPLRGLDPNTETALLSQVQQDYPEFEVLFGVREESDPAADTVRRLQTRFPNLSIKLIIGGMDFPNSKVGVLSALAQQARYPIWVVNDGDIRVGRDYLASVTAPLQEPSVGVVTCPYRAMAHNPSAAWESLGISTDFMPSTYVAQTLGVREFGLGSTLAFRAADLAKAGGFAVIGSYIADDYQLAKRITALGKRALLSHYVVETSLGEDSWAGVWHHQLRWARTIRTSKGGGYAGLPVTHAGLWAVAAICLGAFRPAFGLIGVRLVSALFFSRLILRHRMTFFHFWLAPVWDLYAFAVWLTSYFGTTVRWRDRTLQISSEGRIRT